jgi:predicted regulator of Ras-like GTPase activity (Roadblock/LC7/MglB family)
MEAMPNQQAALEQLAAAPGVVGSMVFDAAGDVVASAFPPVFDPTGLNRLAGQLAADGYFNQWLEGEKASLDLLYADGQVVVRSLAGSWLLVLCTAQVNAQLLSMSLTQVVRRLKIPGSTGHTGEHPLPASSAPTAVDRLQGIASAELGAHAEKALQILAAAGTGPKELLRATAEIEKLTRLFIDKKKAEEIGRRMRAVIEDQ